MSNKADQQVRHELADSILRRIAERYKNCSVNIYPDLPELTPVEAVLRCAQEEGFMLTQSPASPVAPAPACICCYGTEEQHFRVTHHCGDCEQKSSTEARRESPLSSVHNGEGGSPTGQTPASLAAEIIRGLENRGWMDLAFNLDDATSAREFVAEVIQEALAPVAMRETAQPSNEFAALLDWALSKIEFPMVADTKEPYSAEQQYYKGCPGCRVVWTRDMEHKSDCIYVRALRVREAAQPARTPEQKLRETLLHQWWHKDCEIIPAYMPPHPNKDTRPIVAVRYKPSDSFLRHSAGPRTGTFWDVYGDNFLTEELAVMELAKAPAPASVRWVSKEERGDAAPSQSGTPEQVPVNPLDVAYNAIWKLWDKNPGNEKLSVALQAIQRIPNCATPPSREREAGKETWPPQVQMSPEYCSHCHKLKMLQGQNYGIHPDAVCACK